MADSVYRVTEVIGTSSESWEAAARNAVETAANIGKAEGSDQPLEDALALQRGQRSILGNDFAAIEEFEPSTWLLTIYPAGEVAGLRGGGGDGVSGLEGNRSESSIVKTKRRDRCRG